MERLASNRTSQDWTWNGIGTLIEWTYDPADQLLYETSGTSVTSYTFGGAGNQQVVQAPTEVTTYAWDSENRLREIELPLGARNTMLYPADGLRYRLQEGESDLRRVWDSQGTSGHQDLLEENQAS